LEDMGLRGSVDERSEKTGKKIRDAELIKIPYMLIVGEKEQETESVSVRKQAEGDLGTFSLADFAKRIDEEVKQYL
ncbi:MAG: threonine--tRNA ligase, partial [Bacteroidales bacterium]|nr:threonine--tRNA ligase [Bacteroidales bacterium]